MNYWILGIELIVCKGENEVWDIRQQSNFCIENA